MRRWKRSDISERLVLEVYSRPFEERYPADEVLMRETGAPEKVVWAAMMREDDRGSLDYGVNLRGGWLTKEGGGARLAALRGSE
ncbi:MAG: hypothetical protein CML55_01365 [Rhodobacteraceae bacterium]|nr:hypothetical protein [Paracoccaceae bacterium]MBO28569.1 hypothetical protein [Paracoccaceae bacterium]